MPRMLSLWLDFGAKVCECEKSEWPKTSSHPPPDMTEASSRLSFTAGRADRQMRQELSKINSIVSEHCANLAPYQFLTAFSQLISRVCHSSDEVFAALMNIVAKVFLAYPQQAMWLMAAVSKVTMQCFSNHNGQLLYVSVLVILFVTYFQLHFPFSSISPPDLVRMEISHLFLVWSTFTLTGLNCVKTSGCSNCVRPEKKKKEACFFSY